ncbi:hypothetical protein C8J57DRAFT_1514157 [Mycena rebaudengoi]|nr:hypothetical protein C8J57DRAFT_1514157 [Mycena rebaudengoi]
MSVAHPVTLLPASLVVRGRASATAPRLPVEVLAHVLSFIDEYDPPYSTQDYISFRGTLRLVFRHLVASVPCLWAHILLTPTLHFEFATLCFHLARNYPTRIHVRAAPNSAFHSFRHNGLTVYQHYRRLLHLAASAMSTCAEITVETHGPRYLDITMEALTSGVPSILSRISVVLRQDPPDFRLFHPPCLTAFAFPQPPSFGQPFRPLVDLSITVAQVLLPVFTHVSSLHPFSLVQLPPGFRLQWQDLLRLLTQSTHIHTLLLNSVHICNRDPSSMIGAPPIPVERLDIAFGGLRSMAEVVAHIPFPRLTTLRVRFVELDDIHCLAVCAGMLANITELVLLGIYPRDLRVFDIFRFCFNLQVLDVAGAETQFFSSFYRASTRMPPPGQVNYNACPFLRHLTVSNTRLWTLREMLESREAAVMDLSVGVLDPASGFEDAEDSSDTDAEAVIIAPRAPSSFPDLDVEDIDEAALRSDPLYVFFERFHVKKWPLRWSLATEFWAMIFGEYCLLDGSTPRAYVASRRELIRKHPLLARFVAGTPGLWSMFAMDAYTSCAAVAFAVERVPARPLDVDVFLSAILVPRIDETQLLSAYVSFLDNTREAVSLLGTTAHRWRHVRFVATSSQHGRILHELLESVTTPFLSSFELVLPGFPLELGDGTVPTTPTMFTGSVAVVQELSLHGYALPWTIPHVFSRLQSLTLSQIPPRLHPTMSQFSLVLRSAPLLETLILTGPFHLQKEDNYSYSPFSMDNMSQLHLSSIGESSELALARFLCSVEMPAIHHLRLSYMGQGFRAAMAFAPLVGRVVCLTMVADERFGQFADDFLLAFSWVEDVDLRLVGSQFFDALAANPDACDFFDGFVARARRSQSIVPVYDCTSFGQLDTQPRPGCRGLYVFE